MELRGTAKRIRIYLKESDVIGHKRAPYALLDWLRREGAAGVTLIRGTAGAGSDDDLDRLGGLPGRRRRRGREQERER